MIPVHHGYLSLPRIFVRTPLEMQSEEDLAPSIETYQMHGAEKVLILPRGNRSTFIVDMYDEG